MTSYTKYSIKRQIKNKKRKKEKDLAKGQDKDEDTNDKDGAIDNQKATIVFTLAPCNNKQEAVIANSTARSHAPTAFGFN